MRIIWALSPGYLDYIIEALPVPLVPIILGTAQVHEDKKMGDNVPVLGARLARPTDSASSSNLPAETGRGTNGGGSQVCMQGFVWVLVGSVSFRSYRYVSCRFVPFRFVSCHFVSPIFYARKGGPLTAQ